MGFLEVFPVKLLPNGRDRSKSTISSKRIRKLSLRKAKAAEEGREDGASAEKGAGEKNSQI